MAMSKGPRSTFPYTERMSSNGNKITYLPKGWENWQPPTGGNFRKPLCDIIRSSSSSSPSPCGALRRQVAPKTMTKRRSQQFSRPQSAGEVNYGQSAGGRRPRTANAALAVAKMKKITKHVASQNKQIENSESVGTHQVTQAKEADLEQEVPSSPEKSSAALEETEKRRLFMIEMNQRAPGENKLDGQDLEFFLNWFSEYQNDGTKSRSLAVTCEQVLRKAAMCSTDSSQPNALRTAVAFSVLDHIIPILGAYSNVVGMAKRELALACYGPASTETNSLDYFLSTPYFLEKLHFGNWKRMCDFNKKGMEEKLQKQDEASKRQFEKLHQLTRNNIILEEEVSNYRREAVNSSTRMEFYKSKMDEQQDEATRLAKEISGKEEELEMLKDSMKLRQKKFEFELKKSQDKIDKARSKMIIKDIEIQKLTEEVASRTPRNQMLKSRADNLLSLLDPRRQMAAELHSVKLIEDLCGSIQHNLDKQHHLDSVIEGSNAAPNPLLAVGLAMDPFGVTLASGVRKVAQSLFTLFGTGSLEATIQTTDLVTRAEIMSMFRFIKLVPTLCTEGHLEQALDAFVWKASSTSFQKEPALSFNEYKLLWISLGLALFPRELIHEAVFRIFQSLGLDDQSGLNKLVKDEAPTYIRRKAAAMNFSV